MCLGPRSDGPNFRIETLEVVQELETRSQRSTPTVLLISSSMYLRDPSHGPSATQHSHEQFILFFEQKVQSSNLTKNFFRIKHCEYGVGLIFVRVCQLFYKFGGGLIFVRVCKVFTKQDI